MTQLAPIDYYFYRPHLYTIQFAFEYNNKISKSKIVEGIERLLVKMPVLGSVIKVVSNYELVLEMKNDIPIREHAVEGDFQNSADILFDTVRNIEAEPLIKILISHANNKSYVGFSFSHLLGDGASFFIFLDALSQEICRSDFQTKLNTERSKLCDLVQLSNASFFDSTGYIHPRSPSNNYEEIEQIYYTNETVNQMKASCIASGVRVSANDIIMADLVMRFHKNVPLFQNKFIVRCPVDYRKMTGIGQNYFGNAVKDAIAIFDPNELENLNLVTIAKRIRKSIESVEILTVKNSLSALDQFRRENGINAFQELGCPGLLVSNLSKFPIAKIDLGSGVPVNFHHASLNQRLALILPTENGYMAKVKLPK